MSSMQHNRTTPRRSLLQPTAPGIQAVPAHSHGTTPRRSLLTPAASNTYAAAGPPPRAFVPAPFVPRPPAPAPRVTSYVPPDRPRFTHARPAVSPGFVAAPPAAPRYFGRPAPAPRWAPAYDNHAVPVWTPEPVHMRAPRYYEANAYPRRDGFDDLLDLVWAVMTLPLRAAAWSASKVFGVVRWTWRVLTHPR